MTQTPISWPEARAIRDALQQSLFETRGMSAKGSAQYNLRGRTHYADDDTLRFHKSRIVDARPVPGTEGLLYQITESAAKDFENSGRGFRAVIFDLTGRVVGERPAPDELFKSSAKANAAADAWLNDFDVRAYYVGKMRDVAQRKRADAERLEETAHKLDWGLVEGGAQ